MKKTLSIFIFSGVLLLTGCNNTSDSTKNSTPNTTPSNPVVNSNTTAPTVESNSVTSTPTTSDLPKTKDPVAEYNAAHPQLPPAKPLSPEEDLALFEKTAKMLNVNKLEDCAKMPVNLQPLCQKEFQPSPATTTSSNSASVSTK